MKEIFLHEIRGAIFGGKALVAFALMLAAFLISLGMMSREHERRLENYSMSISLPAEQLFWNKIFFWEFDDGDFTSSDNSTEPLAKVKEPDPMIFFARGFDTEMRQGVDFLANFPIIELNKEPEQEKNLLHLMFPAPDLLFMVKVLVSLLAMVFAYNIFCGEREQGTLKLMLSAGASRGAVFGGKFLGGLVSVWTAFTAAFLVYLLALSFLTPVSLGGDAAARVALIYAVSLLHIAVFFGLGAVISASTRNSAPSMVLTLFVWIVVVFVLPGLAALTAQQFAPVDSEDKVARLKFEKATDMEREYAEANPGVTRSYTGSYGARHDEIRHLIAAELQKIDDENERSKALQTALTSNLARVSPVGSLSHLFTSLSRTGIDDVRLFREDLLEIRTEMDRIFTEFVQDPNFLQLYMEGRFDIPEEILEVARPFIDVNRTAKFSVPSLSETLASTWIDFGLLGFFAVAAAALTFTRFIFYDPR